MKRQAFILPLVCVLSLALNLTAAETPASPAMRAVTSMERLRVGLQTLDRDIAATAAGLDKIKEAGRNPESLKQAYATFKASFTTLQNQSQTVRAAALEATVKVDNHLEAWQADIRQMQNEALRKKAQKRHDEASAAYKKAVEEANALKEISSPWVADLEDIVRFLDADLTSNAVRELSGFVSRVVGRTRAVRSKNADTMRRIDGMLEIMPK